MNRYSLSHVGDRELDRGLACAIGQEQGATATVLAYIAESDARKRYLPAGYPSTFAYCVGELGRSEDAAYKRIKAARAARRFPAIFDAVADSRLHLSAVVLLAPHLTPENAAELLAAATHQSKSEIERLLAERFPRTDLLAWVEEIPASSLLRTAGQQAPGPVEDDQEPTPTGVGVPQQAPGPVPSPPVPERAGDRARVQPLALGCFGVQFNLSQNG